MAKLGKKTASSADAPESAGSTFTSEVAGVASRIRAGVVGRGQSITSGYSATEAEQTASNLISVYWRFMPLIFTGGIVIALCSGLQPSAIAIGLMGCAIFVTLFGTKLRQFSARPDLDGVRRGAIAAIAVALPMFLFGVGMGAWAYQGGEARIDILAGFVFVIALTSMAQSYQRL
ncbi:MAG: hypothetical protein R3E21_09070 [Caenibius sp.]